jgi:hypothetical protein
VKKVRDIGLNFKIQPVIRIVLVILINFYLLCNLTTVFSRVELFSKELEQNLLGAESSQRSAGVKDTICPKLRFQLIEHTTTLYIDSINYQR